MDGWLGEEAKGNLLCRVQVWCVPGSRTRVLVNQICAGNLIDNWQQAKTTTTMTASANAALKLVFNLWFVLRRTRACFLFAFPKTEFERKHNESERADENKTKGICLALSVSVPLPDRKRLIFNSNRWQLFYVRLWPADIILLPGPLVPFGRRDSMHELFHFIDLSLPWPIVWAPFWKHFRDSQHSLSNAVTGAITIIRLDPVSVSVLVGPRNCVIQRGVLRIISCSIHYTHTHTLLLPFASLTRTDHRMSRISPGPFGWFEWEPLYFD